jgi:hypothetical protein
MLRTMLLAAAVCTLGASANAATITIDAVGDAFTVHYSGFSDQDPDKGFPVSVDATYLTTIFTSTQVQFRVTLDNTSPTDPAQLTGFGFNTDPDAISGSSTSLIFPFVSLFANGGFSFDVCVQAPPESADNCAGNSGNADKTLGVNDTPDIFFLTLNFADTTGGVIFSDFGARLQGIGQKGASAKIYGEPTPGCTENCVPPCTVDCDPVIEGSQVPEPGTLLLLGSGAVVAFRRRFRRQ